MADALAWVLLAAFAVSPILFLLSVLDRDRPQQSGFWFSLLALPVYAVTYSVQLHVPHAVREPLRLLGADEAHLRFTAGTPGLLILAGVYAARFAIWQRLAPVGAGYDERRRQVEERVYDFVAPLLAYVGLAATLIILVRNVAHLGGAATAVVTVASVVAYFTGYLILLTDVVGPFLTDVRLFFARWLVEPLRVALFQLVKLLLKVAKLAHPEHLARLGQKYQDRIDRRRNAFESETDRRRGDETNTLDDLVNKSKENA